MLPNIETPSIADAKEIHSAVYIIFWIVLSSVTILYNKYLLSNLEFHFPAILTCWHLIFATIATQVLARTTKLLDGRKTVGMTGRVYLRAIVPIGVLYSASLVCSNQVYLYLSIAFIQMLKASAPMAVLLISFLFGIANPKLKVLFNVLIIVFGVALASIGEIHFVWLGFFYQIGGIVFEAIRLVMIQILLSEDGQSMDPLVGLYYYAPVSAVMNLLVALTTEANSFAWSDVSRVGTLTLLLNATVAFLLNVSSVLLIGRTSGLVMTLCGVLKNIVLVIASVMFWGSSVTGLQFLGYTIATAGLLYYGVDYESVEVYYTPIKEYVSRLWEGTPESGMSSRALAMRKLLIIGMYALISVLLTIGIRAQSQQRKSSG